MIPQAMKSTSTDRQEDAADFNKDGIGATTSCEQQETGPSNNYDDYDDDDIFGSDLCAMFETDRSSKTDACAVFCCGICLWQRNHDLLTREKELETHKPDDGDMNNAKNSVCCSAARKRPFETVFTVLLLAMITLWSLEDPTISTSIDGNVDDSDVDDETSSFSLSYSHIASVLCLILICLGIYRMASFQSARSRFRKQLAIAEYYRRRSQDRRSTTMQVDKNLSTANDNDTTDGHNNNDDDSVELAAFLKKHDREINGEGAHACCGCARKEDAWCFRTRRRRTRRNSTTTTGTQDDNDNDDDDYNFDYDFEETNYNQGFCYNAWRFLANACCGLLCGCHLQLCGTCAIAQESRYLRDALMTTTTREQQHPHPHTTSFVSSLWQRDYITMQPWSEYYPSILRLRFSNQTYCLAHFKALSTLSRRILLSVLALFLFVTGLFLLPVRFPKWQVLILYCTFLQPVVFMFFVHWLWSRTDLSFDAVVKYFACGFFICTSNAVVFEWAMSLVSRQFVMMVDRISSELFELFGDHPNAMHAHLHSTGSSGHIERPLWYQVAIASLTAFINAAFVAGTTEEVCKYLCFWMVEHPDLELRNKVILSSPPDLESRNKLMRALSSTSPSAAAATHGKSPSPSAKDIVLGQMDRETTGLLSRNQGPSSYDPEQQQQVVMVAPVASVVSIGEAITVAMITVALGFACAENLLYIFVYTPPGLGAEISTLYVRCLFPIHPMAAALQSIGVCRRDLEKDSSVGIGRILWPAWLLHGTFDASLMAFTAIKKVLDRHNLETKNSHYYPVAPPGIEPGQGEAVDADQGVPFLMYVMVVPFVAMLYFLNESFYQRERLEQLDRDNRRRTQTAT